MIPQTAASALSTLLTDIVSVLTSCVDWMKSIGTAVVETPILLVPAVIGIAMAGVALFKSLSH